MKTPMGYLPILLAVSAAHAQTAPDDQQPMQEVVITGSRIIQTSANAQQPISIIDRNSIERTGLASIGDLLQQVTAGGKALNSSSTPPATSAIHRTAAASARAPRRWTCATSAPSACWSWSTASAG
jgi:hypothetical protein